MRLLLKVTLNVLIAFTFILSAEADTTFYTYAKANVRELPSEDSRIVKVFGLGTQFRTREVLGDWYEVVNSDGEVFGYIYGENFGYEKPEIIKARDDKAVEYEIALIPNAINILGKWGGVRPGSKPRKRERFIIVKDESNCFILKTSSDGTSRITFLETRKVNNQVRFYEENNPLGQYYVIRVNGRLGVFNQNGIIRTIPKIK